MSNEEITYKELHSKIELLEKQLAVSNAMFDFTFDWEAFYNPEGKLLYVNKSFERITGYSCSELIEGVISMNDIVDPNDIDHYNAVISRCKNKETIVDFEFELLCKDQHKCSISLCAQAVYTDNTFIGFRTSCRDITEFKYYKSAIESKNKILASKEKYFKIIDTSTDGFLSVDLDGNIVEVNKSYCTNSGYTKEELQTMNIADVEVRENAEKVREHILLIIDQGHNSFESIHRRKDGSHYFVQANVTYSHHDGGRFYCFIHDISEHKRIEQDLNHTVLLLSHFIKNSPIYTYIKEVTPTTSKVLYASDNFVQMIGQGGNDIKGKTMYELFPDDFAQRITTDDWEVVKQNEILMQDEDFNGRNYTTIKFPIKQDNKTLLAGYTIDITERILANQTIHQQYLTLQKLDSDKNRFIQILAHDLKSPFNALIGFSDLLLSKIRVYDIDKLEKYANTINTVSKNTFQLLESLLLWIKAQSGKLIFEPENLYLSIICNEAIDELKGSAENKEIQITESIHHDTIVYADKNMLLTTLRNLISNAIKYTHNQGSIHISATASKDKVLISVADSGVGIPPETIEKLFSMTEKTSTEGTNSEKGTGLGLLLCKEFIEKHGGEIWVESELNKGSTFKFTIPIN